MPTKARYLFDTNICIYLLDRPGGPVLKRVEACDEGSIVTSAIVYAEVMIGVARHEAIGAARALFGIIRPQAFDTAAGDAYARLPFRRGRLDRLIAAHALALNLTLVTNNERDFVGIPGLRVENWTA